MEVTRRHRLVQDQENMHVMKVKANALPAKKQGLGVRGALGDLNANVQAQREIIIGKVAVATAEFEKKASVCRSRSYNHVQSKIDTGLTGKSVVQPSVRPPLRREDVSARSTLRREEASTRLLQRREESSTRPPLRREESTASHAAKASLRVRASDKENKKPTNKESSTNIPKKTNKMKNSTKIIEDVTLPSVSIIKPVLKDSTESLRRLKIGETTSIINVTKLNKKCMVLDITPELPSDVEDIDLDLDPVLLMSPYVKDIYRYLMELEVKYQILPDHLRNQKVITHKMRATLLDWLVEVHYQFKLALETFHMTVGIIDRYLQAEPNVQRNQLQLVGVTALFVASKYEEVYAPDIDDFVYVTDRSYSKKDLIRCERDIMMKLKFCLARPIPLSFLRRFVRAAHGNSKNHHLAKYFVDLCLIDYSMAHYRPSELSAAAICLSLYLLSRRDFEDIWTPSMEYYTSYRLSHIEPIVRQIARIVANVEKSAHEAVYKKYQDVTLAKVASLPQLKSEELYELAELSEMP